MSVAMFGDVCVCVCVLTPTDEGSHSATIVVLCFAIVCVCVCVCVYSVPILCFLAFSCNETSRDAVLVHKRSWLSTELAIQVREHRAGQRVDGRRARSCTGGCEERAFRRGQVTHDE